MMNKLYYSFCSLLLCTKYAASGKQNPPFQLAVFTEITASGEFFYGMNAESSTQKQTLSFD